MFFKERKRKRQPHPPGAGEPGLPSGCPSRARLVTPPPPSSSHVAGSASHSQPCPVGLWSKSLPCMQQVLRKCSRLAVGPPSGDGPPGKGRAPWVLTLPVLRAEDVYGRVGAANLSIDIYGASTACHAPFHTGDSGPNKTDHGLSSRS